MLPSLRLIIYFALSTLGWIAAAMLPEFLVIASLYNVVLIFVAVLDLLLSPQPRDFDLERQVDPKMNLGAPNAVLLRVRFKVSRTGARQPVRCTVRDEPPLSWPVELTQDGTAEYKPVDAFAVPPVARVTLAVAPGRSAEASYIVVPTRRGDFQFGALSARYKTALGLWHRQFRRDATENVRVYPDNTELRRYELRLRQGRLRDMGLHLLRLRGRGTEYESLRDYTTDDEFKDINWKATARRGKLTSTSYEIERDQTIVIALDCGRMMTALAVARSFRSDGRSDAGADGRDGRDGREAVGVEKNSTAPSLAASSSTDFARAPVALSKLDCAINATVLLAHVAASMGDSVGLLLFTDTVKSFVPPRKGRTQIGVIIEALYAAQPALVEPDYATAYQYLMARKVRRALVVTFTDLIDPFASRELLAASGALRRHHNALCVTINNHDVMDMAAMMPQRVSELYEKAMAQRMLAQRAGALEELRQHGVGILDVPSEQLTVATVNRYFDLKSRAAL